MIAVELIKELVSPNFKENEMNTAILMIAS